MAKFVYDGPAYNDNGFIGNYKAYTTAPSSKKARSNIVFRIKKDTRQNFISIDSTCLKEIDDTNAEKEDS